MEDSARLYTIGQVADLTGMSTQLIRKWELRYQVVHPQRLGNGYRAYSDDDVQALIAVQRLVHQGFALNNAISSVTQRRDEFDDEMATVRLHYPSETLQGLILLGERSDSVGLSSMLKRLLTEYGLETLVKDVLPPFLHRIGDLWEEGAWSEYQEHIASQVVRDFFIHVRSAYRTNPSAPLVMGSCVPYERHEIPMQMILTQAAMKGWRTVSLGSSPAEYAIESAVRELNPDVVLLSVLTTAPFDEHPWLLGTLDDMAKQFTPRPFFIGGRGIEQKIRQGVKLKGLRYAATAEILVPLGQPRMN